MTTNRHSKNDPFAPFVSPLGQKRRKAKRLRATATFLAIATAIVLFFSSAYAAANGSDVLIKETPRELTPIETFTGIVTGYSSTEAQTDDTPFTTASGSRVHVGTIACPARFKFGTKVKIWDSIFTCEDRMAPKFRSGNYFDIWYPSENEAIHLGRVRVQMSVLQ